MQQHKNKNVTIAYRVYINCVAWTSCVACTLYNCCCCCLLLLCLGVVRLGGGGLFSICSMSLKVTNVQHACDALLKIMNIMQFSVVAFNRNANNNNNNNSSSNYCVDATPAATGHKKLHVLECTDWMCLTSFSFNGKLENVYDLSEADHSTNSELGRKC